MPFKLPVFRIPPEYHASHKVNVIADFSRLPNHATKMVKGHPLPKLGSWMYFNACQSLASFHVPTGQVFKVVFLQCVGNTVIPHRLCTPMKKGLHTVWRRMLVSLNDVI
jgi:hypothetical protein